MRKLKTYESFLGKRYKFEANIIDPILLLIRNNQEYLTQPANLPQLAKLGYMYNTLWYAGGVCWGSSGLLIDPSLRKELKEYEGDGDEEDSPYQWISCEDNPKYKIEMCNPMNDEIENLIYDAWGMHVSDLKELLSFEKFCDIIRNGVPLTELERKMLKINKTFEEWVEILTDKGYKYRYLNKKGVADHLLCTIGTGYGLNSEGFVYNEASGADQDEASYGDWRNAKFRADINMEVEKLLAIPELKETMETYNNYKVETLNKKKLKEKRDNEVLLNLLKKNNLLANGEDLSLSEILDRLDTIDMGPSSLKKNPVKSEKYHQYYPISSSSKIYIIGNKESQLREGIKKIDTSYLNASIEICKDILEHESEERKENVKFAKEFLAEQGIEGYTQYKVEKIDKYEILDQLKDYFSDFTDNFGTEIEPNQISNSRGDSWTIYLNDTRTNSYADNNYYITIIFSKRPSLPETLSPSIDVLKDQPFYNDLNNSIDRIKHIKEIKCYTIYYNNLGSFSNVPTINIELKVNNSSYTKNVIESDQDFLDKGFKVGSYYISLGLEKMKLQMLCAKPKTLGSKHPNNKPGNNYHATSKQFTICDDSFNKLLIFNIDERGFNLLSSNDRNIEDPKKIELSEWILSEFAKMKSSNPNYGTYEHVSNVRVGKEGKEYLYAQDFMIWLKNNQI